MQIIASALTFLERYHKHGDQFLNHIARIIDNETWILFVNVETKDSQSSGCAHIHQSCRKSLNKLCQKAHGNCFLGQERSAHDRIHATKDNNIFRSVLRNTKMLHRATQKKKAWNADIRCNAPS
jgi:hypothetical protein